MKKLLLVFMLGLFVLSINAQTETCYIQKDSVIAGDETSSFRNYFYNEEMQITKVDIIDSASTGAYGFDTLVYNTTGQLITVMNGNYPLGSVSETTSFKYEDERISRIEKNGDNGNRMWKMAHDITYNTEGIMESVLLDKSFTTENAEGFKASFENMVWTDGNLTGLNLIGEISDDGLDTLELSITYDEKKNFEQMLYINEASDLIMAMNVNNLLEMTFVNDESMGEAGTIALKRTYSYFDNNEVMEVTEHPGVFSERSQTIKLTLDCKSDVNINDANTFEKVKIYPNPVNSILNIEIPNELTNNTIRIFSIIGKEIVKLNSTNRNFIQLNIDSLKRGVYLISIQNNQTTQCIKFNKE